MRNRSPIAVPAAGVFVLYTLLAFTLASDHTRATAAPRARCDWESAMQLGILRTPGHTRFVVNRPGCERLTVRMRTLEQGIVRELNYLRDADPRTLDITISLAGDKKNVHGICHASIKIRYGGI